MTAIYDEKIGQYIFPCPHCDCFVACGKNEINCGIFRHGQYFVRKREKTILTEFVDPHLGEEKCRELVETGKILGCGKPFRLSRTNDGINVEKCEYV